MSRMMLTKYVNHPRDLMPKNKEMEGNSKKNILIGQIKLTLVMST
jgi:hypothetical protein